MELTGRAENLIIEFQCSPGTFIQLGFIVATSHSESRQTTYYKNFNK